MKTHLEIEAKYDVADGQQLPRADRCRRGRVDGGAGRDGAHRHVLRHGRPLARRGGRHVASAHGRDRRRVAPQAAARRRRATRGAPPARSRSDAARRADGARPRVRPREPARGRRHAGQPADRAPAVGRRRRVLAELADDSVTGERHDVEGHAVTWRELEIELVDGDRAVLAALDAAVRAAGVLPASSASKVGRVLGSGSRAVRGAADVPAQDAGGRGAGRRAPAGRARPAGRRPPRTARPTRRPRPACARPSNGCAPPWPCSGR